MTDIQKRIEEEAIKYVGHNLPLQEKMLMRTVFKEGANFALSLTAPKWIEIKEGGEMPIKFQKVLMYGGSIADIKIGFIDANGLWSTDTFGGYNNITHWQPLPDNPPHQ